MIDSTPKREKFSKNCACCGQVFFVKPYRKNKAMFCSTKCSNRTKTENRIAGIKEASRKNKGKPTWCTGLTKRDAPQLSRPNNGKNFGDPWAKGKSKETDPRLLLISNKNKVIIQKMYDDGEIDLTKRKTDYKALGLKVSDTISRKLADGTLENQHRFVKGWYNKKDGTQEYYESSYEQKYMGMLDETGTPWTKRHGIRIQYFNPIKQKLCYYVPDFFINATEIHEVKPMKRINEPENKAKIQAAEKYCLTKNLKYKIITEYNLNIKL